jgi:hypothetical protein
MLAADLSEAIGLGLDDIEDLLGKGAHQLPGIDRADPADHPREQVLFDAFGRCRCGGARCRGQRRAEAVTRAPADGYTLHVFGPEAAINATLYDKLNFNFIRDIAPITTIAQEAGVIVLNPSVPAKTVPEFIAYANSNPGKVNMASGGIGTLSHVLGEQFKLATGVKMVHVPYRGGGPAATDLIAGQVQVEFASTSPTIGYIRAGTLRALAVTTATRSEALPDIPAVAEFLPGYEATFWRGIGNQLLMRKPEWARQRAGEGRDGARRASNSRTDHGSDCVSRGCQKRGLGARMPVPVLRGGKELCVGRPSQLGSLSG